MKLAYFTNQYPKISHTFIRREIAALEALGWEIARYTIRGAPEELEDPLDRDEALITRRILDGDFAGLAAAVSRVAVQSPIRFARATALATTLARLSDRPAMTEYMYLAEACRLVQWCREDHIDHLHAHFGTNPAAVAMLAMELGGPGYSFTVHGPEEFDRASVLHLGEKIRRARFVVGISEFGRSQLLRRAPYECWEKIHVVRCGIDSSFSASTLGPPPDSATLVCVGRLSEQKGQLVLLDATRSCLDRGHDVKVVLVGDGELRGPIESRIAEMGLQDHVEIAGWASSAGVRTRLAEARALVLPSFAEGLPIVLMEALALGRPVITTYVAGIPELVTPGRSGWLVPSGSVEKLTNAMIEALTSPVDTLARMGAAGRQDVLELHDSASNAAQIASLFRRYAG